jgi:hypothetical protein
MSGVLSPHPAVEMQSARAKETLISAICSAMCVILVCYIYSTGPKIFLGYHVSVAVPNIDVRSIGQINRSRVGSRRSGG